MSENKQNSETNSKVDKPSATKTILIVEDEKGLRDLIVKRANKIHSWECLIDETGENCLNLCREHFPDLILLDMGLPKISGLSILRMIKSDPDPRIKDIPVIVFTAYGYAELVAESFELGAKSYYTKSEPLSVLFSNIQYHLDQQDGVKQS